MRSIKVFLLVVLTALGIAACGGGGGGSGTDPAPAKATAPAQPVAKKPVQIVAAGDSTMGGVELINDKYVITGDYVSAVQTLLQQQYGDVTITNHSVTATTLKDALTGAEGYSDTMAKYLASSPAQLVVENYALNDFAKIGIDDYRANLVTFIQTVRAVGKIPVLEEPNPICNRATYPQNIEEWDNQGRTIATFVQVIDEVAAQYQVPLVAQYKPILARPNWCTEMSDKWLHPSVELYQFKAANEAAVLGPIVASLQ